MLRGGLDSGIARLALAKEYKALLHSCGLFVCRVLELTQLRQDQFYRRIAQAAIRTSQLGNSLVGTLLAAALKRSFSTLAISRIDIKSPAVARKRYFSFCFLLSFGRASDQSPAKEIRIKSRTPRRLVPTVASGICSLQVIFNCTHQPRANSFLVDAQLVAMRAILDSPILDQ